MGKRTVWGWMACMTLVACGDVTTGTTSPPSSDTITDNTVASPVTAANDTSWLPPDAPLCGTPMACRAQLRNGYYCVETWAPAGMSCSVSDSLPSGECRQGACKLANPPGPAWTWRPGIHHWQLAGLMPDRQLVLAESTSPADDGFQGPYSECRLTRFDPSHPNQESALHAGPGPCSPWVLHRQHALGPRWAPELGRQVWTLVTLDGSAPARDFDLDQLLADRLAAEGVTPATAKPQWLQGMPGQMLLVWQLQGGKVWLGSLSLARLELAWTRQFPGQLVGTPIADELGRLYLTVNPTAGSPTGPQLFCLAPWGSTLWSRDGSGRPVAVFRDTLFLDDGTVRFTLTGQKRYAWPAANASVLLTDSRAAVLAPCASGACTQVTLLRRSTGEVLATASVPGATGVSAHLTADGAVLVLRTLNYPDLMTSPFYPVQGLQRYLLRQGQPLRLLGELLVPAGESLERGVLHEGQWVAVERDPSHNDPAPGANLAGVPTEDLSAPLHGWLTPQGNYAGGLAPE